MRGKHPITSPAPETNSTVCGNKLGGKYRLKKRQRRKYLRGFSSPISWLQTQKMSNLSLGFLCQSWSRQLPFCFVFPGLEPQTFRGKRLVVRSTCRSAAVLLCAPPSELGAPGHVTSRSPGTFSMPTLPHPALCARGSVFSGPALCKVLGLQKVSCIPFDSPRHTSTWVCPRSSRKRDQRCE